MNEQSSWIEQKCLERGLKMTWQRRLIAKVLSESEDHPDVEELYLRASKHDNRVSIATVYRTVRLFEQEGIILRHDFGEGRSRLEPISHGHHDHLINLDTGEVIEFRSEEIALIQNKIAERYNMVLEGARLELYARPKK
ncbi:MAG: Fur family transcriptional regulator [Alphaproteobacteria bacterium]